MDIYQALEMENTSIRKTLGRLLDTTAAQGEERSDFIRQWI